MQLHRGRIDGTNVAKRDDIIKSSKAVKSRKTYKKGLIILLLVGVITSFAVVNSEAYGLTDEERGNTLMYLEEHEIADRQDIMSDFLRSTGFALAKFLGKLVDIVHGGMEKLYDALSFGKSAEIQSLLEKYKAIYKFLIVVSISGLGIKMIMGGKEENQTSLFNNIATILIIVLSLPWMTGALADMTSSTAKYLDDQWGTSADISSLSFASFSRNLVDLKVVDNQISSTVTAKDILSDSTATGAGIRATKTVQKWEDMKFNTIMDWEDDNVVKDKDLWRATVQYPYDAAGTTIGYTYTKSDSSKINYYFRENGNKGFLFGIGNSYYYRYQVISWVDIYLNLFALTFVLGISLFRLGRIVIEIAQANIYMPIIALFDFSSGKKTKQMFKEFVTFFAGFALCIALLGVFFAGWSYLEAQNWNFIFISLMKIILCLAVIDGPSVIERVLGIDVGIKSGLRAVVGLNQGMQLAKSVGSGAKSMVAGKPTGRVSESGKGERSGGIAGMAKGLGNVAMGQKGMAKVSEIANTTKSNLSKTVENVTGGYGVAGAVNHGAEKAANSFIDKFGGTSGDGIYGGSSLPPKAESNFADRSSDAAAKGNSKSNTSLAGQKARSCEGKVGNNAAGRQRTPVRREKPAGIKGTVNRGSIENLNKKSATEKVQSNTKPVNSGQRNAREHLQPVNAPKPETPQAQTTVVPPLQTGVAIPYIDDDEDIETVKNRNLYEKLNKEGGKKKDE